MKKIITILTILIIILSFPSCDIDDPYKDEYNMSLYDPNEYTDIFDDEFEEDIQYNESEAPIFTDSNTESITTEQEISETLQSEATKTEATDKIQGEDTETYTSVESTSYITTESEFSAESNTIEKCEHEYSSPCDGSCELCGEEHIPSEHIDNDANYLCDICYTLMQNNDRVVAVFEFGINRDEQKHGNGSGVKGSIAFSCGEYELVLENCVNVYKNAYDKTGNSALKIGKSEKGGSGYFEFTVSENVFSVQIEISRYKTYESVVYINGKKYELSSNSDDGKYDVITIDTSVIKSIILTTDEELQRCMIDSIKYME